MPKISQDRRLIRLALDEDIGRGDITSRALNLKSSKGYAVVVSKSEGIISGLDQFKMVFKILSPGITFKIFSRNGRTVLPGDEVIGIRGPLEALLTGERTAMNIMSHLSGVATLTSKYVRRVRGLPVKVLDTRKTMPGMRNWEKEAVRHGGGSNHRQGLFDMYLVKENHIAAAGGMSAVLEKIKKHRKRTGAKVEVEVRNIAELKSIFPLRPDYILLDNFNIRQMKKAVELTRSAGKGILLEASGNIKLDNIRIIASTGVDRISIGALTHSAPALDLSFRIVD